MRKWSCLCVSPFADGELYGVLWFIVVRHARLETDRQVVEMQPAKVERVMQSRVC